MGGGRLTEGASVWRSKHREQQSHPSAASSQTDWNFQGFYTIISYFSGSYFDALSYALHRQIS